MKDKLTDLALLWLRVLAGFGLMTHGWLKLIGAGGVEAFSIQSVEPLGFPVPIVFAWLAVAAEMFGGFFFILGLWTRISAAAVLVNMVVAAFFFEGGLPFVDPGKPAKELALCYLVMAGVIFIAGPGRYAVDAGRKGGARPSAKKGKK